MIEDVRHAASGNFQSFKANLGTDTVDILDNFTIKIPGLRENIDNSSVRILEGGHMVFSRYGCQVPYHGISYHSGDY